MAGRKKGSTKAQHDERLEKIETMIAASVPPARIASTLSREWNLSVKQVRRLIQQADELALAQRRVDAPYVRERLLRRAERLTAVCTAEKKYGPAVQSLLAELKMTAALEDDDAEADALLAAEGPPPKDPAQSHIWLQRVMHINIFRLMRSRSIDLLTKMRLFGDWSAKAGLMGDKAIIQEELRQIKEVLLRESQRQLSEGGHGEVHSGPAGGNPAGGAG